MIGGRCLRIAVAEDVVAHRGGARLEGGVTFFGREHGDAAFGIDLADGAVDGSGLG